MSDVFKLTHLFFDQTSTGLAAETRFAVSDGNGHDVGSIGEPDLTTWQRLLRLWAVNDQMARHHLVFQTLDGAPVLSIDQPKQGFKAPSPRVFGRDGTLLGNIGLAPASRRGEPQVSLHIRGADGGRLADVRLVLAVARLYAVCDTEGNELARISGGRGAGGKAFGYDLRFTRRLDDRLHTLVMAAPLVQYLMLRM